MRTLTETITGKVVRDKYGSWEDCSPGLYLGDDFVETLFSNYIGRTIRVTIEEVEPEGETDAD